MGDILTIFQGISVVMQPVSLLYLFGGFFIGIVFGALPGLTSALAIALLLPMTYSMPLQQALIMCMGVYMAGIYSGSITAVTIAIPGAPASAMTCIEGHAMMLQGKGAQAIGHATLASAIGGSIGALLLIFVSSKIPSDSFVQSRNSASIDIFSVFPKRRGRVTSVT